MLAVAEALRMDPGKLSPQLSQEIIELDERTTPRARLYFAAEGSRSASAQRRLYAEAASAGLSFAMVALGATLLKSREWAEAFQWYEKAAARNHPVALHKMGYFYDEGLKAVVRPDRVKAISFYERSVALGMADSMHNLALLLEEEKPRDAIDLLKRAVLRGRVSSLGALCKVCLQQNLYHQALAYGGAAMELQSQLSAPERADIDFYMASAQLLPQSPYYNTFSAEKLLEKVISSRAFQQPDVAINFFQRVSYQNLRLGYRCRRGALLLPIWQRDEGQDLTVDLSDIPGFPLDRVKWVDDDPNCAPLEQVSQMSPVLAPPAPGSQTATETAVDAPAMEKKASKNDANLCGRLCSVCKQELPRKHYSNSQWKKPNCRTCVQCMSKTAPA
jgi:TPR repeat protein